MRLFPCTDKLPSFGAVKASPRYYYSGRTRSSSLISTANMAKQLPPNQAHFINTQMSTPKQVVTPAL